MVSPAGFIADVNWQAPQPATGPTINVQNPWSVTPLLKGATIQDRGIGNRDIVFAGIRGTLEVYLTTGAAGTVQAPALLVKTMDVYPVGLAIGLDATNRPYAILYDNSGAIVGESMPSGAAIPAGTPLVIRLAWNSTAPVDGGKYAYLTVNGAPIPAAEWVAGTDPVAAWTSYRVNGMMLGEIIGPFSAFTGTLHKAQLSPLVVL